MNGNKIAKMLVLMCMVVFVYAICDSIMPTKSAKASSGYRWAEKCLSQSMAANATDMDTGSDFGIVLKKFNASTQQHMDFLLTLDEDFCPGGSLKDIKLGLIRGTALTISTHPQAENATWEFESQVYGFDYRIFSSTGAVTNWLSSDWTYTNNATGTSDDLAAGQMFWIPFHGQINGLHPGDTLLLRVYRDADNSGDNSTSTDTPAGIWMQGQICS